MKKIFRFYGLVLFLTAVLGFGCFMMSRTDIIVVHTLGNVFFIMCVFVFLGMFMLGFSEIQDYYREKNEREGKFD